jgi:hypothetical protein
MGRHKKGRVREWKGDNKIMKERTGKEKKN